MISCMETVLVYNEFFIFLEEKHGTRAVEDYWRYVADTTFDEPRRIIKEEGLEGVYKYLNETWKEEGDVFEISRDERSVTVAVHDCSSVRKLHSTKHIKPYSDYCRHCLIMYQRLFGDLGYDFQVEILDPDRGACRMYITRRD